MTQLNDVITHFSNFSIFCQLWNVFLTGRDRVIKKTYDMLIYNALAFKKSKQNRKKLTRALVIVFSRKAGFSAKNSIFSHKWWRHRKMGAIFKIFLHYFVPLIRTNMYTKFYDHSMCGLRFMQGGPMSPLPSPREPPKSPAEIGLKLL